MGFCAFSLPSFFRCVRAPSVNVIGSSDGVTSTPLSVAAHVLVVILATVLVVLAMILETDFPLLGTQSGRTPVHPRAIVQFIVYSCVCIRSFEAERSWASLGSSYRVV